MTFDEWWKECSGWYTEAYDASGLSEWCLAKDAWDYHSKRIAELEVELTELREALEPISTALDAYGVGWCRNIATAALLQESSDE